MSESMSMGLTDRTGRRVVTPCPLSSFFFFRSELLPSIDADWVRLNCDTAPLPPVCRPQLSMFCYDYDHPEDVPWTMPCSFGLSVHEHAHTRAHGITSSSSSRSSGKRHGES